MPQNLRRKFRMNIFRVFQGKLDDITGGYRVNVPHAFCEKKETYVTVLLSPETNVCITWVLESCLYWRLFFGLSRCIRVRLKYLFLGKNTLGYQRDSSKCRNFQCLHKYFAWSRKYSFGLKQNNMKSGIRDVISENLKFRYSHRHTQMDLNWQNCKSYT